ncbi:MAG: TonB-dependent receptor [Rikenellaceae bacterium]
MRLRLFLSVLFLSTLISATAHNTQDSIKLINIDRVVISGNAQERLQSESNLAIEVVDQKDMTENFTGNLMKTLEYIPGVQAMSVGSGFSKPMIRGMGFNRVSVIESGVKQEGQQWGADHGLEIDAFNIERVNIVKGSASLLYGGDAMGGVIDIMQPSLPTSNGIYGSVDMLARSVNDLFGGSAMMAYKYDRWYVKLRHSEQHFADFYVPTDHVVYLTQVMPITDNHVNNTAGLERSSSVYARYGGSFFSTALSASDTYQKAGFYPGAHGVPSSSSVVDDGDIRDIDLPYSEVNHLKISSLNKFWWKQNYLTLDLAYQNNDRKEWSAFHTHYSTQVAPEVNPDMEIALLLENYSANTKLHLGHNSLFCSTLAADFAYTNNQIEGYSFLLPNYTRTTAALAWVVDYNPNDKLKLSAGVRYDAGYISSEQYEDPYLVTYLEDAGYSDEIIEANRVRSYALERYFGDYSLSLGGVWNINSSNNLHFNLGRSFRLPTANELVSNGVHHSAFRHEKGTPTLDSERGWQADVFYGYKGYGLSVNLSPYVSWYSSYIYQQPMGEWSILPHAGQIYEYQQTEALLAGGEVSLSYELPLNFRYDFTFEYSYTYNVDESIALPFTPPTTMRNTLSWKYSFVELSFQWQMIAEQTRIARNEECTPGANLFNAKAIFQLPFITKGATAVLSADNIFNTFYLNHLSYYRQIEIPEGGANVQLSIKIPFKL